jgi:D-glycero-D-manno-heptose 1,7-bisphosphate phosphatase
MSKRPTLPTLFLDRDGTLIREQDYLSDPRKVHLLSGVAPGLRRLKRAGFSLVVVSNQSGVARGLITPAQLEAVKKRFLQVLTQHKAAVDGYFVCPHASDAGCSCRKPNSGLLRKASRDLGIPWRGGISIGDRPSDVQLAQRADGHGVLVLTGYGRQFVNAWKGPKPVYTAKNFKAFIDWVMSHVRKDGSWISLDN